MLPCWSRSDGEENVGDQEFFDDQQDQQEFANQGKYSMGPTLMFYSPFINYSFACV
jgi:hypothetical protein